MNKLYTHKLFALTIILCVHIKSTAQTKVGAVGGLTISEFTAIHHENVNGIIFSANIYPGYHAGLSFETCIPKKFQLQYGVNISMKGSGTRTELLNGFAGFEYRNIQLIYIALPVNLTYTFYKNSGTDAFVGTGLYGARATYGVETGKGISYNEVETYKILNYVAFENHDSHEVLPTNVNRYEVGWNLLAGLTINHFQISGMISRGFTNVISNANLYGGNYKNTTLSILLGYYISLKKHNL